MRTGNPYTGFPIMVPLSLDEALMSWNFANLVELDGDLKNVFVSGLDGYQISEALLDFGTSRFNFNFNWPQITAKGFYALSGRFGGLIPIFGQGNYIIDPRSEGNL